MITQYFNYCIVQKFRGTKLSRLDHHVSIRRKTFAFASVSRTLTIDVIRKLKQFGTNRTRACVWKQIGTYWSYNNKNARACIKSFRYSVLFIDIARLPRSTMCSVKKKTTHKAKTRKMETATFPIRIGGEIPQRRTACQGLGVGQRDTTNRILSCSRS